MVNWTKADEALLVKLSADHADDSLHQLTKIFNRQAECRSRTATGIVSKLRRLDAKPSRAAAIGTRVTRKNPPAVHEDDEEVDELEEEGNDEERSSSSSSLESENEARSARASDGASGGNNEDDVATADSPPTSVQPTPSAPATRKRTADHAGLPAPSISLNNVGNSTTRLSPGEDLIKTLESHLTHSALLIALKQKKVG